MIAQNFQFNNYYNILTMFSIFWSITSLLPFDICTVGSTEFRTPISVIKKKTI
jgi:hypothetical protein